MGDTDLSYEALKRLDALDERVSALEESLMPPGTTTSEETTEEVVEEEEGEPATTGPRGRRRTT